MKQNSIFCKNCGSYSISENYQKELEKMQIDEVKLFICSDCGHDNFIRKDEDNVFTHFRFIPLYRGEK